MLIDGSADRSVAITAPAGYGKTTTVRLWEDADLRPFAWVNLDRLDNDLVHLVRHIAAAVSQVQPVPPAIARVLSGVGRSVWSEMVPALRDVSNRETPFVVVFDDVHILTNEHALDCITSLIDDLPRASSTAFLTRSTSIRGLARRRMDDGLLKLSVNDMVMTPDEARAVFDAAGLDLEPGRIESIVERTEGWPGGLHLAALALAGHRSAGRWDALSGAENFVAEYLVDEVLATHPDATVEFLERSSVLDRMSPDQLDELLDSRVSGRLLADIEASGNAFLVPLDAEHVWFRYHHLFRELLHRRLWTRDPGVAPHPGTPSQRPHGACWGSRQCNRARRERWRRQPRQRPRVSTHRGDGLRGARRTVGSLAHAARPGRSAPLHEHGARDGLARAGQRRSGARRWRDQCGIEPRR